MTTANAVVLSMSYEKRERSAPHPTFRDDPTRKDGKAHTISVIEVLKKHLTPPFIRLLCH